MKKIIAALAASAMLFNVMGASAASFITGGDMTEVNYIESLGGVYKDFDGNKVDPFEFMASQGVNMARIRLSNTTGKGTGDGTYYLAEGFQDEDDCFELCKRAKNRGMGIQFTFNYSDYWSNGERQIIPSKWVEQIKTDLGYDVKDADFLNSMTSEQKKAIQDKLGDIVYDYTRAYMQRLAAEDIYPEYVSLGNEINGGMFFPFGNTYNANMNSKRFELVWDDKVDEANDIKCYEDWSGLTSILNRGYDAVKEVSPDSQIVIHIANGSNENVFKWFFDKYKSAGGKFDVIGASYYPSWSHNTIETCAQFCKNISARYDKNILIMETGYNWNATKKNGYAGQLNENAPGYEEKYPYTPEGQKNYLADLFAALSVPECRCDGVLYWDPCMIHVEDPERTNYSLSRWAEREDGGKEDNVVENTTLFDFDGKALPALDVFGRSEFHAVLSKEDNKVTALLANNYSKKKVSLIIAQYDDKGVLSNVKVDKTELESAETGELSIENISGEYKVFLWNGDNLSPLEWEDL